MHDTGKTPLLTIYLFGLLVSLSLSVGAQVDRGETCDWKEICDGEETCDLKRACELKRDCDREESCDGEEIYNGEEACDWEEICDREETCDRVGGMLAAAAPPKEVVTAVLDSDMTLAEATVSAMRCGGQDSRAGIAAAGVELAGSLAEARSVTAAVVAAAGEASPEAASVRQALRLYEKTAKQPPVYESDYVPHGGGVSPST